MAWFEIDLYSEKLNKETAIEVVMPDYDKFEMGKCKCLTLLHGKGDNQTKWFRRTSAERYAKKYNLAIIMPDVKKSFYTDMYYGGGDYWSYITEELPVVIRKILPALTTDREGNYIAGLSMGGYGALKTAFTHTDQYSKVAAFSAIANIRKRALKNGVIGVAAFGNVEALDGSDCDLQYLAKEMKEKENIPEIYICCGIEDFLYDDNVVLHKYLEKIGVNHKFEQWTGIHDWDFWDTAIEKGIRFLCDSGRKICE